MYILIDKHLKQSQNRDFQKASSHLGFGYEPVFTLGQGSSSTKCRNLIFFGYSGWDKGNNSGQVEKDLSFFTAALTLKAHIARRFPTDQTDVICAWHKNIFIKSLMTPSAIAPKIRQIHYVGHGAGGGLYFGYKNKIAMDARAMLAQFLQTPLLAWTSDQAKRSYALKLDAGLMSSFFTDGLDSSNLAIIKAQLAPDALMHIWGCFAGAPTHTFDTSDFYWNLFNNVGTSVDGVARHSAKSLGIKVTAVWDPKGVHGMNFCIRQATGKFNCTDIRQALVPQWLWPRSKSVRWITYDSTGNGNENTINFLGTSMSASRLKPGAHPPIWFTNEIPIKAKQALPAFPGCSASP